MQGYRATERAKSGQLVDEAVDEFCSPHSNFGNRDAEPTFVPEEEFKEKVVVQENGKVLVQYVDLAPAKQYNTEEDLDDTILNDDDDDEDEAGLYSPAERNDHGTDQALQVSQVSQALQTLQVPQAPQAPQVPQTHPAPQFLQAPQTRNQKRKFDVVDLK